jgi:hypothetical protein
VVVDAGLVTTFAGHPLTLGMVFDGYDLVVELRFVTDPAVDGVAVRTSGRPDGWAVECVNFDDASGRGSAEPVLLGELADSLVFLHFRAFRYGRTADHTVHYTVFRVAKPDVGWTPG